MSNEQISEAAAMFKRVCEIDELDPFNCKRKLQCEKEKLIDAFEKFPRDVQSAAIDLAYKCR